MTKWFVVCLAMSQLQKKDLPNKKLGTAKRKQDFGLDEGTVAGAGDNKGNWTMMR